jgi:glycosyltransferase involved in cell wall biosynthesis
MKRVLFLNEVSEIAGTETLLTLIMAHLDPSRYRPIIACPPGPIVERMKAHGIDHIPFNFRLRRLKTGSLEGGGLRVINPFALVQKGVEGISLARIIQQQEIDIVHSNSLSAHIAGLMAARLVHVPIVWHIHTHLMHLLYRFTLPDALIFVSDFVLHTAFPGTIPAQARRIYNGIDLTKFNPDQPIHSNPRQEFGVSPDQPLVAMIGFLDPIKGQHEVIQAWRLVLEKLPQARLLLVGKAITPRSEVYAAELKAQVAALGLTETIMFAGYRPDVAAILQTAEVYVSFTLNDTLSMMVIEAMTMRKAIIGANSGGLPELIVPGESGLLVDKGDIEGLAAAILHLLNDPAQRAQFGIAARQRALAQFDIQACVAQIQAIYDRL